ncbi:helix-turn-helix transcriptional regulator [Slackia exigua]|nr:helix-turn-helix transcriptional regulator [Slackia exigua]STN98449.1 transcriptional regulator MalT [Slackia exigua]
MATLEFSITASLIVVASIASAFSISSYIVSRKRMAAFLSILTFGYAIEQIVILYREFLNQNIPFRAEIFSSMEDPLLRIAIGAVMCESLMIAVIEYYDSENRILRWIPIAIFLVACVTVCLVPDIDDRLKKWFIYSMRQIFLMAIVLFCLANYMKAPDGPTKKRYERRRLQFTIVTLFILLTLVEDTLVMLTLSVDAANLPFAEVLYRRNISESLLAATGAGFLMYASIKTLRAFSMGRFQKNTEAIDEDETLSFFSEKYGLTQREEEIMRLVVESRDNQNIANELQLALGTVKTHIHNIFKKTDCTSRGELINKFWMNS